MVNVIYVVELELKSLLKHKQAIFMYGLIFELLLSRLTWQSWAEFRKKFTISKMYVVFW